MLFLMIWFKSIKIVSCQLYGIGIWCNGSTTDFGSVCSGSNPDIPTIKKTYSNIFYNSIFKLCLPKQILVSVQLNWLKHNITNVGIRFESSKQGKGFLLILYLYYTLWGGAVGQLVGLITRRSVVRVYLPQQKESYSNVLFGLTFFIRL